MKKAFTLVELLVVIGIIGILSGVLIASFSGSSDSARAAKCLTNLKNLASASQLYSASNYYVVPPYSTSELSDDIDGYVERAGWVSWLSSGMFPAQSKVSGTEISTYNQNEKDRIYSLTNGALWRYISGNSSSYVCAQHVNALSSKFKPIWSYVANNKISGKVYKSFARADRTLLFAEMPFDGTENGSYTPSSSKSIYNDCQLQSDNGEVIGFNHSSGKGEKCAHVVFADGHVEKLRQPKGGLSDSDKQELTKWLCQGKDISFDGKSYEKLTD